jgi:hypothetical protein
LETLSNPEIQESLPASSQTKQAEPTANSAANGAERIDEIPVGNDYRGDVQPKWLMPFSGVENRKSSGNADGGLERCNSSVRNYGGGTLVKCGVRQINAGQHSNE